MNPDKFTHKTNEALAAVHELAVNHGHAQLTPLHLALALLSDPNGIFHQATSNPSGGNDDSVASFERFLNQALKKIPSQHPPPDEVPASTSLIKCIRRALAQVAQKVQWMLRTCSSQCWLVESFAALVPPHWRSTGSTWRRMLHLSGDSNRCMWLSPVWKTP